MKLLGKNLVVSAGGSILAASKSCTLNIEAESIETSSVTDGQWRHYRPGRKQWTVSTNHLLEAGTWPLTVEAASVGYNPISRQRLDSCVKVGTNVAYHHNRGYAIYCVNEDGTISRLQTFDAYDSETVCSQMADYLNDSAPDKVLVIITFDAYRINEELKEAISSNLKVDMSGVPSAISRSALVVIGSKIADSNTGIVAFQSHINNEYGAVAYAKLNLANNTQPATFTPLRNHVATIGQIVDISLQVDGLGRDRVHGTALCEKIKVNAAQGNLITGEFSFKGTGALE